MSTPSLSDMDHFHSLVTMNNLLENTGIYLHEIQGKLYDHFGATVCVATICKTLRRMGCCRSVIRHIALQRSDELRGRFIAEISIYEPEMIIWIDESGCDRRNSTSDYKNMEHGMENGMDME